MGIAEMLNNIYESNQAQLEDSIALRQDVRILDYKWRRGKLLFFIGAGVLAAMAVVLGILLYIMLGIVSEGKAASEKNTRLLEEVASLTEENQKVNAVNQETLALLKDCNTPVGECLKQNEEYRQQAVNRINNEASRQHEELRGVLSSIQEQLSRLTATTTPSRVVRSTPTTIRSVAPAPAPTPTTAAPTTTTTVKGKGKK